MLPSAPLAAGTCGLHGRRRRGAYISTCAVYSIWALDLPVTTARRNKKNCMVPYTPRCCCLHTTLFHLVQQKHQRPQQKHQVNKVTHSI